MVAEAGELAVELVKELGKLCTRAYYFRSTAEQFKRSTEALLPIIQEIQHSGVELPQHRQSQFDELAQKLRHGLELARRASSSSRWNVYKNLQLSQQMEKVERSVAVFMKRLHAHVMADVHRVRVDFGERMERFERRLEEGMGGVRIIEEEEERDGAGVLEGLG